MLITPPYVIVVVIPMQEVIAHLTSIKNSDALVTEVLLITITIVSCVNARMIDQLRQEILSLINNTTKSNCREIAILLFTTIVLIKLHIFIL